VEIGLNECVENSLTIAYNNELPRAARLRCVAFSFRVVVQHLRPIRVEGLRRQRVFNANLLGQNLQRWPDALERNALPSNSSQNQPFSQPDEGD